MPLSDGWRKYLEAGAVLSQVTRVRAEEIVRELVNAGDLQRGQAEDWIEDLVERSRRRTEDLLALVRHEVDVQLHHLGLNAEDLTAQAVEIIRAAMGASGPSTAPGRSAAPPRTEAVTTAPPKKAPPKTAPPKKVAKQAPAKKAPPKKAAKKAPVKKQGAKKAAKQAAAKPSAAKKKSGTKAPAKKAPAKKTPAKKAAKMAAPPMAGPP
jgi:polyhydroxyalkanoate synthesis regulator phasin